jgi:hypothetical protein
LLGVLLSLALPTGAVGGAAAGITARGFTVRQATDLIRVIPQHPTPEVPFRGPGHPRSVDLQRMTRNPGSCDEGVGANTPTCRRWSAAIRHEYLGGRELSFTGRHGWIDDTVYVFRDESGAMRVFPIIEKIWTQGVFSVERFPASTLSSQATGLAGNLTINTGPDTSVGFLWRVRNVVFQVFYDWKAPPQEAAQLNFRAALRMYADDVNRRARSRS